MDILKFKRDQYDANNNNTCGVHGTVSSSVIGCFLKKYFFDSFCLYGLFYGVPARSNRALSFTGGPYQTVYVTVTEIEKNTANLFLELESGDRGPPPPLSSGVPFFNINSF